MPGYTIHKHVLFVIWRRIIKYVTKVKKTFIFHNQKGGGKRFVNELHFKKEWKLVLYYQKEWENNLQGFISL